MQSLPASRIENSLRNLLSSYAGFFVTTLLGYVSRVLLARYLSMEYLGIHSLFANIISVLSLAELGIGSAIGYALYKPLAQQDEEQIAALMGFFRRAYHLIGLLIAAIGLAFLPFLDQILPSTPDIPENLQLLYLIFLFDTVITYFFSYKGTLLTAAQKKYIPNIISYCVSIAQHLVQIVILVTTRSYVPYLLTKTLGIVINHMIIARMADRHFPFLRRNTSVKLPAEEKTRLFGNMKALTVQKLSAVLVNHTDHIVIAWLKGLVTTGIASNYALLSATLTSLVNQVFNSMTASIGNLNAVSDTERKHEFFETVSLANFWLFSWAGAGLAFVSSDLVSLLFGEAFVLDDSIPFILAVNVFLLGISSMVQTYKTTMGLFRQGQYLLLITAGINLVLDFLLGKRWGLIGIYAATAIARMVTTLWYDPLMLYRHGFHKKSRVYFFRLGKYLILFAAILGLCHGLCQLCPWNTIGNLLVKTFICSAVPNGIVFLSFRKTREYRHIVQLIRQMLRKLKATVRKS